VTCGYSLPRDLLDSSGSSLRMREILKKIPVLHGEALRIRGLRTPPMRISCLLWAYVSTYVPRSDQRLGRACARMQKMSKATTDMGAESSRFWERGMRMCMTSNRRHIPGRPQRTVFTRDVERQRRFFDAHTGFISTDPIFLTFQHEVAHFPISGTPLRRKFVKTENAMRSLSESTVSAGS